MDIKLYNNLSDINVVGKTLTNEHTLTGNLCESCNVEAPDITIEESTALSYNYAYIPDFGRYYFFSKAPTVISGNIVQLHLQVDVLESFKTEIRSCKGIISRQEHLFNTYLDDPELDSYAYEIVSAYAFPDCFTKSTVPYLTLIGGVES